VTQYMYVFIYISGPYYLIHVPRINWYQAAKLQGIWAVEI